MDNNKDKWDLGGTGIWHAAVHEFLFQAYHVHTWAFITFVGIFLFPYKLPDIWWR